MTRFWFFLLKRPGSPQEHTYFWQILGIAKQDWKKFVQIDGYCPYLPVFAGKISTPIDFQHTHRHRDRTSCHVNAVEVRLQNLVGEVRPWWALEIICASYIRLHLSSTSLVSKFSPRKDVFGGNQAIIRLCWRSLRHFTRSSQSQNSSDENWAVVWVAKLHGKPSKQPYLAFDVNKVISPDASIVSSWCLKP